MADGIDISEEPLCARGDDGFLNTTAKTETEEPLCGREDDGSLDTTNKSENEEPLCTRRDDGFLDTMTKSEIPEESVPKDINIEDIELVEDQIGTDNNDLIGVENNGRTHGEIEIENSGFTGVPGQNHSGNTELNEDMTRTGEEEDMDIGNTSIHLDMSRDSSMDTSTVQDEEAAYPEDVGVIDYGVIAVPDTKSGILGTNTGLAGFSMIDLTIIKTESLADDQIPSPSYHLEEHSSIYDNPDSTTGVDYTPRKVDSPANVSSTQDENNHFHGNRLVLGKRKPDGRHSLNQESKSIKHDLGEDFEHVTSARVLLYNLQKHLNVSERYCPPCGILFGSKKDARSHLNEAHVNTARSHFNEAYVITAKSHFNEAYANTSKPHLNEALAITARSHSIEDQEESDHGSLLKIKENVVKCVSCHKIFTCREDLIQHIYNKHVNISNFTCSKCKKGFSTQSNLRRHEFHCGRKVMNKPLLIGKKNTPKIMPKLTPSLPSQSLIEHKASNQSSSISTIGSRYKYSCSICNAVVLGSHGRKAHRRNQHPLVKKTHIFYLLNSDASKKPKPKSQNGDLIPINTLFFCPKCNCAFVRWTTAEEHFDSCRGFMVDKKECTKCNVSVDGRSWITHIKQHALGSDFQFVQMNSKSLSELLLFECPLCFVCFDDSSIMHHFNTCQGNVDSLTRYMCSICNIDLPFNYMRFHNMAHDKNDTFIVIKHGVINNIDVKKDLKVSSDPILTAIRNDSDERIKLIYCVSCRLYQHMSGKNMYTVHVQGRCLKSRNQIPRGIHCRYCGLRFSIKTIKVHYACHEQNNGLKLRDFAIYNTQDAKKMAPPLPRIEECKGCSLNFYYLQGRRSHRCETDKAVLCTYCNKKYSTKDIEVHKEYHLYARAFRKCSEIIPEKQEGEDTEPSRLNKVKLVKKLKGLVKCQYCHVYITCIARHLKLCNRKKYSRAKFCPICKVYVSSIKFNLHYRKHKMDDNANKKAKSDVEAQKHKVFKCVNCYRSFLTENEKDVHSKQKCATNDYEPCNQCGLIFDNHKSHVAAHRNDPTFVKGNVAVINFNKDTDLKYVVYQCELCNTTLVNSNPVRHRDTCLGTPSPMLKKCSDCGLTVYSIGSAFKRHRDIHRLDKDFKRTNIHVVKFKHKIPKITFKYRKITTAFSLMKNKRKIDQLYHGNQNDEESMVKKRKLETQVSTLNNSIPKLQTQTKKPIRNYKSMSEHNEFKEATPEFAPTTSKRRSVAIEDPFKPGTYQTFRFKKVTTIETKKYVGFKCEQCNYCFLNKKAAEEHTCVGSKLNECERCGLMWKTKFHNYAHTLPDFNKENITVIPNTMLNFTVFRCKYCKACSLVSMARHSQHCYMRPDENQKQCELCSLFFSPGSLRMHQNYCGHHDTMYVIEFDPFDCTGILGHKNEKDCVSDTPQPTNISHVSETDVNESKHEINYSGLNKRTDVAKFYKCVVCLQALVKTKAVDKHQCLINSNGNPIGCLPCKTCKLFFTCAYIKYHEEQHTLFPDKYATENIVVEEFSPNTKARIIHKNAASQKKSTEDVINKVDKSYQDTSKQYDKYLNDSQNEEHFDNPKQNNEDNNGTILFNMLNDHKRQETISHVDLHLQKSNSLNLSGTSFDNNLVKEEQTVCVYKCKCTLDFVDYSVFCSHVVNCDKTVKVGKHCDDCKLNLNDNQHLVHQKKHHGQTSFKFKFDPVRIEDEIPVMKRLYQCKSCFCHFTIKLAALKHRCIHNLGSRVCSCGLKFCVTSIKRHTDQYKNRSHSKDEFEIEVIENSDLKPEKIENKQYRTQDKHKIFRCISCRLCFTSYKSCSVHTSSQFCKTSETTQCKLCSNIFTTSEFVKHDNDHQRLGLTSDDILIVNMKRDTKSEETSSVLNPSLFQCSHCNLHFMIRKACQSHIANNCVNQQPPQKCSYCGLLFSSTSLNSHINLHHRDKNKVDPSTFTIITFERQDLAAEPQSPINKNATDYKNKLYRCLHCNVSFVTEGACNKHNTYKNKLKCIQHCQYCGILFSSITLHKHLKMHHVGGKNAGLAYFDIIDVGDTNEANQSRSGLDTRSTPNKLVDKIKVSPKKQSPPSSSDSEFNLFFEGGEQIDNCPKKQERPSSANSKSNLFFEGDEQIGDSSEIVLYKCTECHIHCFSEKKIEVHWDRGVHNKLPFSCNKCGLKFGRYTLPEHMKLHHMKNQNVDAGKFKIINYVHASKVKEKTKPGPSALGKVKYFLCKECNTCFVSQNASKKHFINHQKLTEYSFMECKICHLNFYIHNLAQHMKEHEALKLLLEDICIEEYCLKTGTTRTYLAGKGDSVDDTNNEPDKNEQDSSIHGVLESNVSDDSENMEIEMDISTEQKNDDADPYSHMKKNSAIEDSCANNTCLELPEIVMQDNTATNARTDKVDNTDNLTVDDTPEKNI